MNKKILTAAFCVALTATSLLAADAKISVDNLMPKASVTASTPSAPTDLSTRAPRSKQALTGEQIKKLMENRRAQEKSIMYEALKLTEDQKAKAEALDIKTKNELKPLIKGLRQEMKKLQDLKSKKVSIIKIWKQQFVVNSTKSKVKTKLVTSKNEFEAILTAEQKAKYKKIEAVRHKEMQQFHKNHKPGVGSRGMAPGPKGGHGPKHMGPPPEGMDVYGKKPMGPPPPPEDGK